MTAAFQTGQFHTGSYDTPATEPSLFVAVDNPAQSAVDAEEVVTQQLAAAAGGVPATESEAEPEAEPESDEEEVEVEDLTVSELKAILDEEEVDYPSTARKPELVKLVKEL